MLQAHILQVEIMLSMVIYSFITSKMPTWLRTTSKLSFNIFKDKRIAIPVYPLFSQLEKFM